MCMFTKPGKDPHHCRCFFIYTADIEHFRRYLLNGGFTDGLQESHGQLFGYMLRVEDKLQCHIKVMPDGQIESEMELPHAYPVDHLNPEYSYSAHEETKLVLVLSGVRYDIPHPIPDTCKRPKIKEPDNPIHVSTIVGSVLAGAVAGAILGSLFRDDDDDDKKYTL